MLLLAIFQSNNNSEGRGGLGGDGKKLPREIILRTMSTPKAYNLEDILYDNQDRGSVAETSGTSQDNITTLTPSVRTKMEIASYF